MAELAPAPSGTVNRQASRQQRAAEVPPCNALSTLLSRTLGEMESLGIVTQLAGKIVGGVALTCAYYQHLLATEGRVDPLASSCALLVTKRRGHEVALMPLTQDELSATSHPSLPRESPILGKIMSPAALTDMHWSRVPAVAIFGCFVADEQELQEAVAAGIPISPSISGPHPEELMTQMEVFFKQHKYPEHTCFILRDWGFVIFGPGLPEAMASFEGQLKEALIVSTEGADTLPASSASGGGRRSSGQGTADGGGGPGSSSGGGEGVLTSAFKRLQARVGLLRTATSEPGEDVMAAALKSPTGPGGSKAPGRASANGELRPQQAASEPSSPMIGADLPDSLRHISVVGRRRSSEYRVPSFQTGFKPW